MYSFKNEYLHSNSISINNYFGSFNYEEVILIISNGFHADNNAIEIRSMLFFAELLATYSRYSFVSNINDMEKKSCSYHVDKKLSLSMDIIYIYIYTYAFEANQFTEYIYRYI